LIVLFRVLALVAAVPLMGNPEVVIHNTFSCATEASTQQSNGAVPMSSKQAKSNLIT
jgi:hypothetical protein